MQDLELREFRFYESSYVLIKNEIYKICEVHQPENAVRVRKLGDTKSKSFTWGYILKHIKPECPKLGAFNVNESSFYCSRIPARQWRRGLNQNTIQYHYFNKGLPNDIYNNLNISENNLITSIFSQDRSTFNDAFKEIYSGKALSRAIASKLVLSVEDENSLNLYLFYKDNKVGEVTENKEIKLQKKYLMYKEYIERCTKTKPEVI